MYNLGLRYSKGEGVQKDPVKAVELYKKAAELNNAFAQYNLAYSYATVRGVTADNVGGHCAGRMPVPSKSLGNDSLLQLFG